MLQVDLLEPIDILEFECYHLVPPEREFLQTVSAVELFFLLDGGEISLTEGEFGVAAVKFDKAIAVFFAHLGLDFLSVFFSERQRLLKALVVVVPRVQRDIAAKVGEWIQFVVVVADVLLEEFLASLHLLLIDFHVIGLILDLKKFILKTLL